MINLTQLILKLTLIMLILILGYPLGYFVLPKTQLNTDIFLNVKNTGSDIATYIINLDRSKERYNYIKNYVNDLGLHVERVSAVDGLTLAEKEINQKVELKTYKLFFGHAPNKGTIGCYLSHIKTLETFLNSNFKFALILEDDVSFNPNALKVMLENLVRNSHLWDVVNLDVAHRGFPLTIKKFNNDQQLVVYLTEIAHTGAYFINKKAAINLLSKALPMKMPIDHYFTRSWEFELKFTGIENPRLVNQTFGGSTINPTTRLNKEKLSGLNILKRQVYKLQSYVIRFFYNLIVYLYHKVS